MGAGAAWVTNGRQVYAKKENDGNGQRGPKKQAVGERSRSGRWESKKATDGQPKRCGRGRRDEEGGVSGHGQRDTSHSISAAARWEMLLPCLASQQVGRIGEAGQARGGRVVWQLP
jgi:hypothetical protein